MYLSVQVCVKNVWAPTVHIMRSAKIFVKEESAAPRIFFLFHYLSNLSYSLVLFLSLSVTSLTHIIAQASVIPPIFSVTQPAQPHKETSISFIVCSTLQTTQTPIVFITSEHVSQNKRINILFRVSQSVCGGGRGKPSERVRYVFPECEGGEVLRIFMLFHFSSSSLRLHTFPSHLNKPLSARQTSLHLPHSRKSTSFHSFFPLCFACHRGYQKI